MIIFNSDDAFDKSKKSEQTGDCFVIVVGFSSFSHLNAEASLMQVEIKSHNIFVCIFICMCIYIHTYIHARKSFLRCWYFKTC